MAPKPDSQVISDFKKYVNMSQKELSEWLETKDSKSTGWSSRSGGETGEAVGHQSGRKIVKILSHNSKLEPSKFMKEDLAHMRKVAAYCKRHLAQEKHLKQKLSKEEFRDSKSTRSLKNWGHDPTK